MQDLQKKIKGYLNGAIGMSLALIVLGVLFLIFPEEFLNILRWVIATISLAAGIYMIASEVGRRRIIPFFSTTAMGAVLIVIGLIFATHEGATGIFAIIMGAWFIVSSLASLRFSAALTGTNALISTITAILSMLAGILLIVNPWGGSISMMAFIGIMMIVYATSSLVDMFVLRRNLKELSKLLKAN